MTGAWAKEKATTDDNRNQLLRMLLTGYDNSNLSVTNAPSIDNSVCILTQAQVEGPYHLTAPMRVDVTEGKPGIPFDLAMQVVAANGCTPVPDVVVEIWHCDAEGNYSAHPNLSRDLYASLEYLDWDFSETRKPTNDDLWLRGAQRTDDNGIVRFKTIFPGWYDMRAPHIHFKIGGPQRELFTSQFYFDDSIANEIYRSHPEYKAFGTSPYNPKNDVAIMIIGGAEGLLLEVNERESGHMQASAKVGIELA
jgi:protocatechuate 3,4-dioxygenase beta subunit